MRGICSPLSSDDLKKISSILTVLTNEKLKAEKDSKGKKKSAGAKSSLWFVWSKAKSLSSAYRKYFEEGKFKNG